MAARADCRLSGLATLNIEGSRVIESPAPAPSEVTAKTLSGARSDPKFSVTGVPPGTTSWPRALLTRIWVAALAVARRMVSPAPKSTRVLAGAPASMSRVWPGAVKRISPVPAEPAVAIFSSPASVAVPPVKLFWPFSVTTPPLITRASPANTLVDFGAGDTILLATASAATQILVSNARGQLVVPGGTPVTLNFGSDLAPESVFAVTSLGAGAGDSITLLPSMFSVASPESLQSALAAIAPGGGSSAPGAAYTITGQSGLSFAAETVALAAGSTLTLTGQAASTGTGLDIASGSVLLTALTYSAGIGETLFTVESGASATLTNDTLIGAIGVAAGGALALLSGTLAASITAASGAVVTAEPAAGATVDLTGALDGVLHVGSASQAAGGRTILD